MPPFESTTRTCYIVELHDLPVWRFDPLVFDARYVVEKLEGMPFFRAPSHKENERTDGRDAFFRPGELLLPERLSGLNKSPGRVGNTPEPKRGNGKILDSTGSAPHYALLTCLDKANSHSFPAPSLALQPRGKTACSLLQSARIESGSRTSRFHNNEAGYMVNRLRDLQPLPISLRASHRTAISRIQKQATGKRKLPATEQTNAMK